MDKLQRKLKMPYSECNVGPHVRQQIKSYGLAFGAVFSLTVLAILQRIGVKVSALPVAGSWLDSLTALLHSTKWTALSLVGLSPALTATLKRNPPARHLTSSQASARGIKHQTHSLHLTDPRVDGSVFQHNIPSFVINHEQRILDWNPAFELVFGGAPGLNRQAPISAWFQLLDNFKRVSKRQDKLFGEAVLPLVDRERASYQSPRFGRMVFTKIMTPIIDRKTGRILGWNIVLNINSVSHRREFFTALYAVLAQQTRRVRHAAAVGSLFKSYPDYRRLLSAHREAIGAQAQHVLEISPATGLLTQSLLRDGHRVSVVDENTELLRQIRDRAANLANPQRLRLVKREPSLPLDLPAERYDAVSLTACAHKIDNLAALFSQAFTALRPGGTLIVSGLVDGACHADLFTHLRQSLNAAGAYDALKHQLQHVEDWEAECALTQPAVSTPLASLRAAVEGSGFIVVSSQEGHLGGHAALLVARKP